MAGIPEERKSNFRRKVKKTKTIEEIAVLFSEGMPVFAVEAARRSFS